MNADSSQTAERTRCPQAQHAPFPLLLLLTIVNVKDIRLNVKLLLLEFLVLLKLLTLLTTRSVDNRQDDRDSLFDVVLKVKTLCTDLVLFTALLHLILFNFGCNFS